MKVRWLKVAALNLEQVGSYIAMYNPEAAKRAVQKITQSSERLALFPESGRPGRVAGTRELVVTGLPYILVYRVKPTRVDIHRVFHDAQRWPEKM